MGRIERSSIIRDHKREEPIDLIACRVNTKNLMHKYMKGKA